MPIQTPSPLPLSHVWERGTATPHSSPTRVGEGKCHPSLLANARGRGEVPPLTPRQRVCGRGEVPPLTPRQRAWERGSATPHSSPTRVWERGSATPHSSPTRVWESFELSLT
jgi:hypothetical protein